MLYEEQNIRWIHFIQCAKIAQSLQHSIKTIISFGLIGILLKTLNVSNLSAATKKKKKKKKLITKYTFFVNSFMGGGVPII